LTSTISMSEICIAFFTEQFGISRRKATLLNAGIAMVLGTLCALSFGPLSNVSIFGQSFFGLFDYVTSNIFLPLGGMLISIFVGWFLDRRVLREQLRGTGSIKGWIYKVIVICLRYVAPTGIALVFLSGLDII